MEYVLIATQHQVRIAYNMIYEHLDISFSDTQWLAVMHMFTFYERTQVLRLNRGGLIKYFFK